MPRPSPRRPSSHVPTTAGGAHVLLASDIAGHDCTEAFLGLHRAEVLTKYVVPCPTLRRQLTEERTRYSRLLVGQIKGQESQISYPTIGALSKAPFSEPGWLSEAYRSPYFSVRPLSSRAHPILTTP